jgi:hypothetical protein
LVEKFHVWTLKESSRLELGATRPAFSGTFLARFLINFTDTGELFHKPHEKKAISKSLEKTRRSSETTKHNGT